MCRVCWVLTKTLLWWRDFQVSRHKHLVVSHIVPTNNGTNTAWGCLTVTSAALGNVEDVFDVLTISEHFLAIFAWPGPGGRLVYIVGKTHPQPRHS